MTETQTTPVNEHLARATDWRIVDRFDPRANSPVHVGMEVHINGEKAAIHLCPSEPLIVRTAGKAMQTETLLGLTVHPDDVTFREHADYGIGIDTIGGVPVLTPREHTEFSWCHITCEPSVEVRPNGSHFPRGDADGAPDYSAKWLRVWVQVRSISFDYAED